MSSKQFTEKKYHRHGNICLLVHKTIVPFILKEIHKRERMVGLEKRKRKRVDAAMKLSSFKGAMDLFVPIPKKCVNDGKRVTESATKTLEQILLRLQETGFKCVAITHIVNGPPRSPDDRANVAMPDGTLTKLRTTLNNNVILLRRLHVIVENISDMALFSPQSTSESELLSDYDLLSIAPRNERVFQAACTCDGVDIVTLDGSASTSNVLPYTLRSTDIQSIRSRRAILEIPCASPILNRTARKGWIQTCRSVITASLGSRTASSSLPQARVPILFSSGLRLALGPNANSQRQIDVGSFAFHSPDDLLNVIQSLLTFDNKTAIQSLTSSGQAAIDHANKRKSRSQVKLLNRDHSAHLVPSRPSVSVVSINVGRKIRRIVKSSSSPAQPTNNSEAKPDAALAVSKKVDLGDADNDDDGFIAL